MISSQDCFHGSPCRERKRGPVAEPHHEVGPAPRHADGGRQFWPHACDLDRLIHKGMLQAERRRLQREALTGTACARPMILVVSL